MSKGSASHKTGGYRLHSGPARSAPPYTATTPATPAAPTAQGLGIAGGKALVIRAKRVLGPLEDPNSAITN